MSKSSNYDLYRYRTFESNPGVSSGTTYQYDALNRLTRQTNAWNQGERYMDALKKLGKQLGVVLLACVLNTGAIADTVTFFHNDISGNPLAATDATGTLLWKENYKRC